MRLIVVRCEVTYSGRLNAFLPESMRLLMLKEDGSVLVHADAGGYKPLNWMTPPTVIEDGGDVVVVRKRSGRSEDRLEIRLIDVLSDVTHDMGEAAALEKDGVERDLQLLLADDPTHVGEGLRLVKREWPTDDHLNGAVRSVGSAPAVSAHDRSRTRTRRRSGRNSKPRAARRRPRTRASRQHRG